MATRATAAFATSFSRAVNRSLQSLQQNKEQNAKRNSALKILLAERQQKKLAQEDKLKQQKINNVFNILKLPDVSDNQQAAGIKILADLVGVQLPEKVRASTGARLQNFVGGLNALLDTPNLKDDSGQLKTSSVLGALGPYISTWVSMGLPEEKIQSLATGISQAKIKEVSADVTRKKLEADKAAAATKDSATRASLEESLISGGIFEQKDLEGVPVSLLEKLTGRALTGRVDAAFKPAADKPERITKDTQGVPRFVKSGERVFPDVAILGKERKLSALEVKFDAITAAKESGDTAKVDILKRGLEKDLSTKTTTTTFDPATGSITILEGDSTSLNLTPIERKDFRGRIVATNDSLRLIDQILGLISSGNIGIKGILKGFAQNMLQQFNPSNLEDNAVPLFDETLPPIDLLSNTLAYALARSADPASKLSDSDVNSQREGLKINELLSNPRAVQSSFKELKIKLILDHNNAIDILTKGVPLKKLPVPGQKQSSIAGKSLKDVSVEEFPGANTEELFNLMEK